MAYNPLDFMQQPQITPYPQNPIAQILQSLFAVQQFQKARKEQEAEQQREQKAEALRQQIMQAQLASYQFKLEQDQIEAAERARQAPITAARQQITDAESLARITRQSQTISQPTLKQAFPNQQVTLPSYGFADVPGFPVQGQVVSPGGEREPIPVPAPERGLAIQPPPQERTVNIPGIGRVPVSQAASIIGTEGVRRLTGLEPEPEKIIMSINGQEYDVSTEGGRFAAGKALDVMKGKRGEAKMVPVVVGGRTITVEPNQAALIIQAQERIGLERQRAGLESQRVAIARRGGGTGGAGIQQDTSKAYRYRGSRGGQYAFIPEFGPIPATGINAAISELAKSNPTVAAQRADELGLKELANRARQGRGIGAKEKVDGRDMTLEQIEDEMKIVGTEIGELTQQRGDPKEIAKPTARLRKLTAARTRIRGRRPVPVPAVGTPPVAPDPLGIRR